MDNTVGIRLAVDSSDSKKALVDFGDAGEAQAKRAARAYEQASDDMVAADRRRAQAQAKLDLFTPQTPTQQAYQAGASTNYGGQSARDSAAAIMELMAAEEQLTARVNAFRASVDPAWVAQGRFNTEMSEAKSLISQGAITLDQYCDKLRIETAALKAASGGADAVVSGHNRMSTSSMILQHVMRSTTDSLAAGMPVSQVLAEQLARLGEAASLAAGEGKGGGKLAGLAAFLGGGWGLAFTAAIGIAGALIPKLLDGADAADVMKEHQQALAAVIDQTTGRLIEQNRALLLNSAIITGKDGAKARDQYVDTRATLARTGYADEDVGAAVQQYLKGGTAAALADGVAAIGAKKPWLKETTDIIIGQAAALTNYARTAQQAAAQQRLLTGNGRPGDQRTAIGQFGPETPDLARVDAEAQLAAATTKSERAQAQATITRMDAKKAYDNGSISLEQYKAKMVEADKAVAGAKDNTDRHAASLARQAESMEVAAKGAIDVANAYLKSSDAGTTAEARRKAATDATKKGIDVDEQARRQLALAAAEQVMNAAKSVASMNDEAAAREAVVKQVQSNGLAVSDMDVALQKETALRPLLAARTRLQGDALKALNDVIDATTAAIDRSSAAAVAFALPKMLQESRDRAIELRAQIGDLAHSPLDSALNAANRAANKEADDRKIAPASAGRVEFVNTKVDEARAGYEASRAKFIDDANRGQQDSIELAQRELTLASANDNYRTSELDKLKLQQDIRRRFPDMAQADVNKLVAGVAAIDAANAKAKLLQDTWSEIRSAGDQFLSDLTNPDGSGLKNLLKDVEQEFIKLAALNPLKNLLLGEKNPTLGGVLGSLLKTGNPLNGGGGKYEAGISPSIIAAASRNASGTEYFSGGQTWLAENGPELVTLPTGSKVTPAPATRRMIANDNGGGDTNIHVYAQGAVLYDQVQEMVAQGMQMAAARGAAGGAQLAAANASKRARYRIPGR